MEKALETANQHPEQPPSLDTLREGLPHLRLYTPKISSIFVQESTASYRKEFFVRQMLCAHCSFVNEAPCRGVNPNTQIHH